MKEWKWYKPEEKLPELVIKTDYGKQSKIVLADYGEDQDYRFESIIYEDYLNPLGEDDSCKMFISQEGEEVAPPERWCYIDY